MSPERIREYFNTVYYECGYRAVSIGVKFSGYRLTRGSWYKRNGKAALYKLLTEKFGKGTGQGTNTSRSEGRWIIDQSINTGFRSTICTELFLEKLPKIDNPVLDMILFTKILRQVRACTTSEDIIFHCTLLEPYKDRLFSKADLVTIIQECMDKGFDEQSIWKVYFPDKVVGIPDLFNWLVITPISVQNVIINLLDKLIEFD